ncbi:hypothetical protein [Bacillus sp. S14(2024)]|uniref:hypothetical protein n=1 Tax=Bacillus sp. S14(2024) TaxID=3162884 RepID=UPI003D25A287
MNYYFSLIIFGFVLTIIGFSFFFVSLKESDWGGKKNIIEYALDIIGVFFDIWSMSFVLLVVGLVGVGLIIYSFMGMTEIL